MINTPFNKGNISFKKYDEMMINIGNHLFEAECMLNVFMKEMADIFQDATLDIEMELSENGSVSTVVLNGILWNDAKRCVELETEKDGNEYPLNWDNLTISVKNLIADYVYLKLLSDGIYRNIQN